MNDIVIEQMTISGDRGLITIKNKKTTKSVTVQVDWNTYSLIKTLRGE